MVFISLIIYILTRLFLKTGNEIRVRSWVIVSGQFYTKELCFYFSVFVK